MSLKNRTTDLSLLHPLVRVSVENILADLSDNPSCGNFKIWEAYRTPERQLHLFLTKTKNRKGRWIRRTKARPWQSQHQYGIAVDLVIDMPGVNKWSTKTQEHKEWWRKMHATARSHLMEPLRKEMAHIQLSGFDWKRMKVGEWPEGGSDEWSENIHEAIERFPKRAPIHGPPVDDENDPNECRPAEFDFDWP